MDEISGMREIFMDIDTDKSGTITVEEFAEALRKKGKNLPEGELNQIMMEADVNGENSQPVPSVCNDFGQSMPESSVNGKMYGGLLPSKFQEMCCAAKQTWWCVHR